MDVAEPSRLFAALLGGRAFLLEPLTPLARAPECPCRLSGVETRAGETRRSFFGCRPITRWMARDMTREGCSLGFPSKHLRRTETTSRQGNRSSARDGGFCSPRVQAKTTTPLRLWRKRPDPSTLLSACRPGDARLARSAPREAVMVDEPRTTHRPAPVRPKPVRMRFAAFSSPLQSRRLASTTVDRASPRTSAPKWCFES